MGFFDSFGDVLADVARGGIPILQDFARSRLADEARSLPPLISTAGFAGGAIARQLPGLLGGVAASELFDVFSSGSGGGEPMFTEKGNARALVRVKTPAGRDTWFRHVGRPLLMSGDVRIMKRTARTTGKVVHRGGHHHHRRGRH